MDCLGVRAFLEDAQQAVVGDDAGIKVLLFHQTSEMFSPTRLQRQKFQVAEKVKADLPTSLAGFHGNVETSVFPNRPNW